MGYKIMDEAELAYVGPGARKSVLMYLARRADDDTRLTRPGFAKIAEATSKSHDTVKDAVKWLEKLGVIERRKMPTGRGNLVQWRIQPVDSWPSREAVTLALDERKAGRALVEERRERRRNESDQQTRWHTLVDEIEIMPTQEGIDEHLAMPPGAARPEGQPEPAHGEPGVDQERLQGRRHSEVDASVQGVPVAVVPSRTCRRRDHEHSLV